MAFECGFFNSINKDRLYNANDMNNPYKRIVSNGVFARKNPEKSTDFQVLANDTMGVVVSVGDGIFKDKWARLTAPLNITLATSHTLLNRIDSIVVKVDESDEVRAGSIQVKSGEYAEEPTPPSLEDTDLIKEYRLANILVEANAEKITQANITDCRPSAECGWITNLLWDSDISATYAQWQAQFYEWFQTVKNEVSTLTGDVSWGKSYYKTTADGEDEITLTLTDYDPNFDLLQVYVSGLLLAENVDYAFDSENKKIKLTNGLDVGSEVQMFLWHKIKKEE